MTERPSRGACTIVPPYLLDSLTGHADEAVAENARRSLDVDRSLRSHRSATAPRTSSTTDHPVEHQGGIAAPHADDGTGPQRTIADAQGAQTTPGKTVRTEGQPATGDPAADEAYDGFGRTWGLFDEAYQRDSLDGRGLPLLGTVHYGSGYDNAFWDGTQMVFGDGDGTVFNRFTIAVDVIGHELTHGVTEHTAGLEYQGQSGALNESLSDVFGSLVKQRTLGQTAAEADWLIGAGLFTDQVQGVALRSMKAPGTAYDDPTLGKDPQPATMAGYVETTDDNGGVHLNSGIPNHAFYLAASTLGGNAWEVAGQVWFDVLTGGRLAATADFATFARLTVAAAESRYAAGSPQASAIEAAWEQVGVLEGAGSGPVADDDPFGDLADPDDPDDARGSGRPRAGTQVQVRRTGGLAGLRRARTVALDELPDEDAQGWRSLLANHGLQQLAATPPPRPIPDAFTYHVACPPEGEEVTLPERGIPEPVRDLLQRTLGD
ncbi:MAG: protealysin inhibitor emfourin [Pedococcus sp.]